MILSSADILRILGGSEIVRLSARLKVVDEKPVLSGEEHLYVCISRFPSVDEFQATWTVWIEGDGEEALVIEEIKRLLPSVKVNDGLITELTTTDFLSASTQRAPEAPAPSNAQMGGHDYEERFQSLSEGIQDQMLLVNSGRNGLDGRDGRDGTDGRDGRDLVATDASLFDLNDTEQGIQMERGQVLTWDGSRWTNLFVPQILSSGGGGGGGSGGGGGDFPEAPTDGKQYARKDATWDEILPLEGPQGEPGIQGPAGAGLAAGGTAGQVLAKVDGSDYNTEWVDQSNEGLQPGDNVSELVNDSGYITLDEVPASGIEEAPQDGGFYVRQDGQWINLSAALSALNDKTIDGGNLTTGSAQGDEEVVDGGDFTSGTAYNID